MVFQQPNPFPKSIYDNVAYGPRLHGVRQKDKLDELVEQSLRQAALWEEVKDFLEAFSSELVRWTTAAVVHCPGACCTARYFAYGRGDICAASDLHDEN